jgi:hypothetical protein
MAARDKNAGAICSAAYCHFSSAVSTSREMQTTDEADNPSYSMAVASVLTVERLGMEGLAAVNREYFLFFSNPY